MTLRDKVDDRTADMHARGKSDDRVVPKKPEVWKTIGDFALHARESLFAWMGGDDVAATESFASLQELKAAQEKVSADTLREAAYASPQVSRYRSLRRR